MASNLIDILIAASTTDKGITFVDQGDHEEFLTYSDIYGLAHKYLGYLQHEGIQQGQELVFQIEDNQHLITIFWACILGGIIPVPVSLGNNSDHKEKLFSVWQCLSSPALVTTRDYLEKVKDFAASNKNVHLFQEMEKRTFLVEELPKGFTEGNVVIPDSADIGFIQFSSGSTGRPKGVVLTHGNLLANVSGISSAADYSQDDKMLSWMSLTHDMGMIGFHLNAIFSKIHLCLIPTKLFVRNPSIWMEKASQHQITVTCSPNFGYRYFLKFLKKDSKLWDLSRVRIIYNGAEPISESICLEFNEKLSRYDLSPNAMCPVYGLAEASVAVSMSVLQDQVKSLVLDKEKLGEGNRVREVAPDSEGIKVVNVGKAIPFCSVSITNRDGQLSGEGVVGQVRIFGENVTVGYYKDEETFNEIVDDQGRLNTGDLGFIKDDCLYITGRSKDVIFSNGQNYYPHDIEKAAEEVSGIELNKIAVSGYFDEKEQQEKVIAFIFNRGSLSRFLPLAKAVKAYINHCFGIEFSEIVPVDVIPKTTSGKLQRFKLLKQYREGVFQDIIKDLDANSKSQSDTPIIRPESDLERRMLLLWKQVLTSIDFGVCHEFDKIGGNSLKAAELCACIEKDFEVELSPDKLYQYKTVRRLALEIHQFEARKYTPITINPKREMYPASPVQKRLYYAWKLDSSSTAYNIPIAFRLKGKLDHARLQICLGQLVLRHDALRMTFSPDSEPTIRVHKEIPFELVKRSNSDRRSDFDVASLIQPFDLENGPLFRFILVDSLSENEDEFILFIDIHHTVSDGKSVMEFVSELFSLYDGKDLDPITVGFHDFLLWEETQEASADDINYWKKHFSQEIPSLEIPTDFSRSATLSNAGHVAEFAISSKTSELLYMRCADLNVTLHSLLFTIYNILLSKYSGQSEIVIGIPVYGRRHPDIQLVHGMFVNNLAITNPISGHKSFKQTVLAAAESINEALEHQEVSFASLLQELNIQAPVGRNPMFDTMFVYRDQDDGRIQANGIEITRSTFDPGSSKFDLSMEVVVSKDIRVSVEYASKLFKAETIKNLFDGFFQLIHQILEDPNQLVADLSLISKKQLHQDITLFNDTNVDFGKFKPVHQLFEEQVQKSPEAIALRFREASMTYGALNAEANKVAHHLKHIGVRPSEIIAISLPRSPELVVCILGIMKAGAAFLPIESDTPEDRVRYVINQSKCRFAIGTAKLKATVSYGQLSAKVLYVDELIQSGKENDLPVIQEEKDLAYVIFTSGTTGHPKGAMIEHQGLSNYIRWAIGCYLQEGNGSFGLYSSISFDMTWTSVFTPLASGNEIFIYEKTNDQELLIESAIKDNKSDILKVTPSHLKLLLNNDLISTRTKTKKFIVGGEAFHAPLAQDIYLKTGDSITIFNEYGPTEATIGCMIHVYEKDEASDEVPIGVPIANTQIYVLDAMLKPVAKGVIGELYISGAGLARGYLFDEVQTENRFILNPFVPGTKMYKTGDLARRLENGVLKFIGRNDRQVKINGHRVELGEVENQIRRFDAVNDVVVTLDRKHGKHLRAYFIGSELSPHEAERALGNHLMSSLPHYMIPSSMILVDAFPLTKNGKIDLDELEQLSFGKEKSQDQRPSGVKNRMLEVWREILADSEIGLNDNFYDLGGDSIKAVQLSSRLMSVGISVKPKDILLYHTIDRISDFASNEADDFEYEQGVIKGTFFPTPVINWFLSQKMENPNKYNHSILLRSRSKLETSILEDIFNDLIIHHDSLRLNYDRSQNELYYNENALVERFLLQVSEVQDNDELNKKCQELNQSFDIEKSLLLKAAVFQMKEGAEYLYITAHHLIIDGLSWRVLLEDLYNNYRSIKEQRDKPVSRKTASFLDWSRKLQQLDDQGYFQKDKAYWRELDKVKFGLPKEGVSVAKSSKKMNSVSGILNPGLTKYLLTEANAVYNSDAQILLNAALVMVMEEWTNESSFIIEQENHGRHIEDLDLSRTVGWFTTIYPLYLESNQEIGTLIKSVKEQFRSVPNQGLGYGIYKYFDKVVTQTVKQSEVRFNYLGQFQGDLNNEIFSLDTKYTGLYTDPLNRPSAKLEFNLMVYEDCLHLELSYATEEFKKETIQLLQERFFIHLEIVLNHIKNEEEIHLTPSDFDSVDLNEEELNALFD